MIQEAEEELAATRHTLFDEIEVERKSLEKLEKDLEGKEEEASKAKAEVEKCLRDTMDVKNKRK